jgi:5-methylcytosine-specific restriction endonuclease McrA
MEERYREHKISQCLNRIRDLLFAKHGRGKIKMGQLTSTKELKIKEAVGMRCEMPGCKDRAREVHHIKPRSERGEDVPSNLIVLCANHHDDADKGRITRTELSNLVKNRNDEVKREIRNILRRGVKPNKYVIIDDPLLGRIKVLIEDTTINPLGGNRVITLEARGAGRYKKVMR